MDFLEQSIQQLDQLGDQAQKFADDVASLPLGIGHDPDAVNATIVHLCRQNEIVLRQLAFLAIVIQEIRDSQ